jgi:glutaredoxin
VPATVTLLSRPGCHLCDAAREVVSEVLTEFPAVQFAEQSIVDDPDLLERYVEDIPVVLINGRVHNIWRIDPERFRSALKEVPA